MKHKKKKKKEKRIYIIFKIPKPQQITMLHFNAYNILKIRSKMLLYYAVYTTKLFFF